MAPDFNILDNISVLSVCILFTPSLSLSRSIDVHFIAKIANQNIWLFPIAQLYVFIIEGATFSTRIVSNINNHGRIDGKYIKQVIGVVSQISPTILYTRSKPVK